MDDFEWVFEKKVSRFNWAKCHIKLNHAICIFTADDDYNSNYKYYCMNVISVIISIKYTGPLLGTCWKVVVEYEKDQGPKDTSLRYSMVLDHFRIREL